MHKLCLIKRFVIIFTAGECRSLGFWYYVNGRKLERLPKPIVVRELNIQRLSIVILCQRLYSLELNSNEHRLSHMLLYSGQGQCNYIRIVTRIVESLQTIISNGQYSTILFTFQNSKRKRRNWFRNRVRTG